MIRIGDEMFKTTAEAQRRASRVLHRHPHGTPITGGDRLFVEALFWAHPRAAEKGFPAIDHFEVRPGPEWPTPNLWVVRTDGTTDNFSIKKSIAAAKAKGIERLDGDVDPRQKFHLEEGRR